MRIPFFFQKGVGPNEPMRALLVIGRNAYAVEWPRADGDARILAITTADAIRAAFPRLPTEITSRVYARHPALRRFLTTTLPEDALWKTVPARHLLAIPERSTFWWGGGGLVDRTAIVRVIEGWNPYVAGTRLPLHVFEAGRLLAPGASLRLRWEETSFTSNGPRTVRRTARLCNADGQALRVAVPTRPRRS